MPHLHRRAETGDCKTALQTWFPCETHLSPGLRQAEEVLPYMQTRDLRRQQGEEPAISGDLAAFRSALAREGCFCSRFLGYCILTASLLYLREAEVGSGGRAVKVVPFRLQAVPPVKPLRD